ncbi:MAG: type II toxin-antitoxin system YoeB family toxin [Trueperaceae bacterium]
MNLNKDIQRQPYGGIGKPEALSYEYTGFWSRRIDEEHRLQSRKQHNYYSAMSLSL